MKVARVRKQPQPRLTSPFGVGGTIPQPALDDLSDVDTTGVSDGDTIVFDDATDTWIPGAGSSGGTPATTVTDETTFGIAPAVGTDTEYARQDHTHGSPDTDTVSEAGRWELAVIPGSPPDSLYADGDWLYIWVT